MSKAKALQPQYNVGEVVNYTDRQNRKQSGKVLHIEGKWTAFGSVYLIYTVQHPSYRNGQMHCGEDVIEGSAK
ncbi:hypothetical protein [Citrobacter amalonaticus]|uniref:hypothetical protein n=1 Tax=Citrobacter amalonaticus TaxID=35703 RepID=UPI000A3C1080|nr:hypothetical protein [Citrobacter amalonaticus]OUE50305.1 hypothetical protein AZ012_004698 [Citrobacter amalonaticus]